MSCQKKLHWHELIPVFSFLGLLGRCGSCKTKISIQYPLVEITTGFIFAMLFLKLVNLAGRQVFFDSTFAITYAYYAVMFSILLVIAVYDLRHKIIPDLLVLVFGILGFVGLFFFESSSSAFFPIFSLHFPTLLEFLSGVFMALPFAFFWLISGGRWMGFGDAKLALGLGWFLALSGGISLAFSGLVIAFWSGAFVGIILVIFSKNSRAGTLAMKSEIPFAPFLVLGAFVAFIFGLNLFPLIF